MKMWVHAAVMATVSGLSLPIGAILGIMLSPVRDVVCAGWVAFGAGALLFAVTVELYGHALSELEAGDSHIVEMLSTVVGAFIGALFYLVVNRWLEDAMEPHDELDELDQEGIESEAHSIVGDLASAEAAPLLPKHKSSVNAALQEERKRWEQMTAAQDVREDSFRCTYAKGMPTRSANTSFSRWPSFSRGPSFAYSEGSFKSRGRDRVLHVIGSSHCSSRKGAQESVADAQSIADVDPEMAQRGNAVAFGLFLGLLVDGVPEGILMGFLAAQGHLSEVLVISLLVANFPEAFSAASLMVQSGMSIPKIISMWTGLCVMVGVLAGASCYCLQLFYPTYPAGDLPHSLLVSVALIEGITGGAMISCIATVMLPEAFARAGGRMGSIFGSSGFLCTSGFLVAVTMKAFEHHYYLHHH